MKIKLLENRRRSNEEQVIEALRTTTFDTRDEWHYLVELEFVSNMPIVRLVKTLTRLTKSGVTQCKYDDPNLPMVNIFSNRPYRRRMYRLVESVEKEENTSSREE